MHVAMVVFCCDCGSNSFLLVAVAMAISMWLWLWQIFLLVAMAVAVPFVFSVALAFGCNIICALLPCPFWMLWCLVCSVQAFHPQMFLCVGGLSLTCCATMQGFKSFIVCCCCSVSLLGFQMLLRFLSGTLRFYSFLPFLKLCLCWLQEASSANNDHRTNKQSNKNNKTQEQKKHNSLPNPAFLLGYLSLHPKGVYKWYIQNPGV